MSKSFTAPITYFLEEGQANLSECMKIAFGAAVRHNINRIVIFTSRGRGLRIAAEEFCSRPEYRGIDVIGVRFPAGKRFTDKANNPVDVDISVEDRAFFSQRNIPIVRANLPFDSVWAHYPGEGSLGQDLSLVRSALNVFGGSMSLCIQAILMACDAGEIDEGEHVIALTSDTAILARSSATMHFLTEFIVREVLCKPAILTVVKREEASQQRLLLDMEDGISTPASLDLSDGGQTKMLPDGGENSE
ncbi:MAG TPA: hypothetical protein VHY48_09955 [Acidobacteriaceae bacterium]|jgi:hypothetical protein|nr:hypothetical protein [Acidobacteriaceae bacterium]